MVAEKGADLVKELWLQEEVVRAEAEAAAAGASSNQVNVVANLTPPNY